jgi:uncharacterized membrane protein
MAARFKTRKYTIPVAGEVSLAAALNYPSDTYVSSISFRAAGSNTSLFTWRDSSGGEDGGYLDSGEAASFDLSGKFVSPQQIFIAGGVGDIVYITVIG